MTVAQDYCVVKYRVSLVVDVWQDGWVRTFTARGVTATVYLGDCLQILPTLGKVDAVVTDPPYGVNLGNHSGAKE